MSDDRLGIVVADVAGKGIAAGLIMSKFSGEFKYLLAQEATLSAAVERMNETLVTSSGMRFLTVAALILDHRKHELEIVNAGHCDTLRRDANGQVSIVDDDIKGTPIGMFPDQHYQSTTINLTAGESIMLFTDGLTEATDANKSLYGTNRIMDQFRANNSDPEDVGSHLLCCLREFVGDHPQSDDMCLVCFQRTA